MDEKYTFRGINRIAIIGAGNAGLTAAKYLLAEDAFSVVDIFEQRSRTGGLWIYNPANDVEDDFSIPQTTASAPLESPIWQDGALKSGRGHPAAKKTQAKEPTFSSPVYERLESNLPKMIMQYSDLDFPDDSQLFPTHESVHEYLERYADDVRHLINFETQVLDVRRKTAEKQKIWSITTRNLVTSEESNRGYDAVVIASGHFVVPYVPDIKGVREWNKAYPYAMSHSKHFRRPEEFSGKKIITIGRGYSGLDIASQLCEYAAKPLIISTYQPGPPDHEQGYVQRPEIAEFLPASSTTPRAVRFVDGHIETNVDHVLFCTGYMYSFPYLPTLTSKLSAITGADVEPEAPIITDGARPHNLYQYIFYNADPTLAVLCMPQQIVPFPVAQNQSAVVARAWAGRLDLPSRREMIRWEEDTVKERGEGKKWLWLKPPLDGRYLNALAGWAQSARSGKADKNVKVNGSPGRSKSVIIGKNSTRWGEKELWLRERILEVKKAFVKRGEGRRDVKTLEELGFDFEEWKKSQQNGRTN